MLDKLKQIIGAPHVLQGSDAAAYETDWRKRYTGKALAVVRPADVQELSAIVRLCADTHTPIITQGGNTGLVGGATPDTTGTQLILSLARMTCIREIDSANDTMTVEAGCVLQAVQDAAEQHQRLFPLSLAAEGSCTMGGNLATNAGGTQVLRYGNARELCLGLEVVTATGEIWHGLKGLRKDNTGYDLRDLFIGSEGTLGIISAATLKLFPMPAARITAFAAVSSVAHAVELLNLAKTQLAAGLTGFELMNRHCLTLTSQHYPQLKLPLALDVPYYVLLELCDHESEPHALVLFERLMEVALEQSLISDAAIAQSLAQSKSFWHIRENIPLAQAEEGLNIKHDISLPISRIAEFVETVGAQLEETFPGSRLVNFGHLGDGNLHFNLQAPRGIDHAAFLQAHQARCNDLVHGAVHARGGSISAEHGIGQLKAAQLPQYKSALDMQLMRHIKQALDPHNLLNPGKVILV